MEYSSQLTPVPQGPPFGIQTVVPPSGEPPITIGRIKDFLHRYKWVILTCFLATALGTYTVLNLLTEMYDTEAKLLVKIGRDQIDPPPTVKNALFVTGMRREEVTTEIQILKSRGLAEQVINAIGLEPFRAKHPKPEGLIKQVKFYVKTVARAVKDEYQEVLIALDLKKRLDEREKALTTIMEDLAVEPEKDSDVVAIRMRFADPELAKAIEKKLIDIYMVERLRIRQDHGVREFLGDEAQKLNGALAEIEHKQTGVKGQYGISSALEQRTLLLRQIRELYGSSAQSVAEISALGRQREELGRQLASVQPTVKAGSQEAPNPLLQSMKEKLTTLQLQRANAITKYQPESTVVKNLDQEIARLEEMVGRQETTLVSSVTYQANPLQQVLEQRLRQTTVDLSGVQSKAAEQREQIKRLESELHRVDAGDVQLSQIERQRLLAEQNYISAEKRKHESEIGAELDKSRISNVSLLSPPSSSLEPVYPRKLLIMGIALALGLLLGVGLSLLMDYMDERVHDPKQLEAALLLPCLATVNLAAPAGGGEL